MSGQHRRLMTLAVLLLSAGCAGPPVGGGVSGSGGAGAAPQARKYVAASVMGQPASVVERFNSAQVSIPGASALEQLALSALSGYDPQGRVTPLLAEAVPSTENGLWRVLPDGHMETSWKIRQDARWQDGQPLTGDDFVFTAKIDRDKELPLLGQPLGYQLVEAIEAPDPRTVTVRWSRPYIDADSMFTQGFGTPLPKHLLEEAYATDKTAMLGLPYWNSGYVGTGPFRVRDYIPGSQFVLSAYEQYPLGRPKIDQIEVRFILDINEIITNLLAGSTQLSLGRGFSIENAVALRDQWKEGGVRITPRSWIVIHPQFIDPNPAVIKDVRFRKAMLYTTDRESLMNTLQGGLTGVAHVFLAPSEPEYREVQDAVARYEYDPRKAASILQDELGFGKGSDGMYRDSTGQPFNIELRTYGVKVSDQATQSIANAWSKFGVHTEPVIVPPQRIQDREYMATFPAFLMYRQPDTATSRDISRLRGDLAPIAETRFVGSNYARYVDAEFDALIDAYVTTIPRAERVQVLRKFVHHVSDNLNLMGLFYDAEVIALSNRMKNVTTAETRLWAVQAWDLEA